MDASDFYLQLIQPILGGNERLIQVGWPGEQWTDGLWGYSTKKRNKPSYSTVMKKERKKEADLERFSSIYGMNTYVNDKHYGNTDWKK